MAPHGARTGGLANGPAGQVPRLVADQSSAPAAPIGQGFIASAHDTIAVRSDPVTDGSGVAVTSLGPVPTNEVWMVERIAIATTSLSPTTAKVYLGAVDPANIVDQTNNGDSDVADQVNPIIVPGGQSLIVRWTGVSPNTQGVARFQYKAGTYQLTPFGG